MHRVQPSSVNEFVFHNLRFGTCLRLNLHRLVPYGRPVERTSILVRWRKLYFVNYFIIILHSLRRCPAYTLARGHCRNVQYHSRAWGCRSRRDRSCDASSCVVESRQRAETYWWSRGVFDLFARYLEERSLRGNFLQDVPHLSLLTGRRWQGVLGFRWFIFVLLHHGISFTYRPTYLLSQGACMAAVLTALVSAFVLKRSLYLDWLFYIARTSTSFSRILGRRSAPSRCHWQNRLGRGRDSVRVDLYFLCITFFSSWHAFTSDMQASRIQSVERRHTLRLQGRPVISLKY